MKRVVVVTDNPLVVAPIRTGLRDSGAFELLGHFAYKSASAARIGEAEAEVVLVDEGDHPERALELIRAIKERDESIRVIVLVARMEGEWLKHALEKGASGAISTAMRPAALATLLRETVEDHLVHPPGVVGAGSGVSGAPRPAGSPLTKREREILRLVACGTTNGEIARRLWITQQTVKFHLSNIYRKLGVANRTEACHYAHVNDLPAVGDETLSRVS